MGKALAWVIIVFIAIGVVSGWMKGGAPNPPPARSSLAQVSASPPPPPAEAKIAQTSAAVAPIPGLQWAVQTDVSAIDDTKSVFMQVKSDNDIVGKYGGRGPATLLLRCMENTTSVMLKFNDHFMADVQGYGEVTYRIDSKKAATTGFEESTDHEWLGLWRGGSAIPFIKGMFGGEKMVVRATPYSESPVEVTFRIQGIEEKVAPLREACGW